MRMEATSAEVGVLSIRDIRAELGPTIGTANTVEVIVIGRSSVFAGVVMLTKKPSGRGNHTMLACPKCMRPNGKLYVVKAELRCRRCAGILNRRARERMLRCWNQLGGLEEDRLLRSAARAKSPGAVEHAAALADELVAGDAGRARAALDRVRLAVLAVEAT